MTKRITEIIYRIRYAAKSAAAAEYVLKTLPPKSMRVQISLMP